MALIERGSAYWRVCLGAALVIGVCNGCGGGASSKGVMPRITAITGIYSKVASELGHTPKDEQEFKQAIAKSNISLDAMKVQSVDELFISERDNQPFVVIYDQSPKGTDIIVYEQTGIDGMRQVGHRSGTIEEIDAAKFAALFPNAGSK